MGLLQLLNLYFVIFNQYHSTDYTFFLKKEFTQISEKYLANIVPMSFEGQENRKILLYLNNTLLQYFLLHIRSMDLRKPFR